VLKSPPVSPMSYFCKPRSGPSKTSSARDSFEPLRCHRNIAATGQPPAAAMSEQAFAIAFRPTW
jgi:hypothetical protein